MSSLIGKMRRFTAERRFASARLWSNDELRRLAPLFRGDVVNVSGWDDRDKEGSTYRKYFSGASSYALTNYTGDRGLQGTADEHFLDLTGVVPGHLASRFDVVFNHTTLEHIYDVRVAFANLCRLSRDIVIVVVPFAQIQHEGRDWRDYWRFTPTCLRQMFAENALEVIYESASGQRNSAIYLLCVASRDPDRWAGTLPPSPAVQGLGHWIGSSVWRTGLARLRNTLSAATRR